MVVADVMTRRVAAVRPEATLKEVAALLAREGVSGVPVVAAGRVVGIVSEADILLKELGLAGGAALGSLSEADALALEGKLVAGTAREAMSAPPVVIAPDRPIAEAARVMTERGVNRLPVVEAGELVGIVSRADLVRAFGRTDVQLWHDVTAVVASVAGAYPARVGVRVEEGRVTLGGEVETLEAAERVAESVAALPGVVSVHSSLAVAAARSRG